MIIYCKRCGYSEDLNGELQEFYSMWKENPRKIQPFTCVECGEVLMNEEDWEVS